MKKLRLDKLKLTEEELLSKDRLKTILGGSSGSGDHNCLSITCQTSWDCNAYCPKCIGGGCFT